MAKKVTQVQLRTVLREQGIDIDSLSLAERWDAINSLWMRGIVHKVFRARPQDRAYSIRVEKAGEKLEYAWASISGPSIAEENPVENPAEKMRVLIPSVLRRPEYGQLRKDALRKAKNVYRLHYSTNGPRSALKAAQGVVDKYTQMAWDQSGRPFDREVIEGHKVDRAAPKYAAAYEWMPYRAMEEREERQRRKKKRRY